MPRYRLPTDFRQRMAAAAAHLQARTPAEKVVLELVRAGMHAPPAASDGMVFLNFGSRGNRKAAAPCSVCGWMSERQCDRIIDRTVLIHGEPKRCDRWLCAWCTYEPEPGKDLCPGCVQLFKAWLAARTNSTDGDGPCPSPAQT